MEATVRTWSLTGRFPRIIHTANRCRLACIPLVLGVVLAGTLVTANRAEATVRLQNGAYGSYGLDCSGYRSARLTVQGGANGIRVDAFQVWVYSVDRGQYVVSGALYGNGNGAFAWNSTTITVAQAPGRYQVYVKYWSTSGGVWYNGGEWTWATNLLQPTSSQTCTIV